METGTELPDHLTNFLLILPKLKEEERTELAQKVLMPAIEKILVNFNQNNIKNDYYFIPLLTLKTYLESIYKMDNKIFGGSLC